MRRLAFPVLLAAFLAAGCSSPPPAADSEPAGHSGTATTSALRQCAAVFVLGQPIRVQLDGPQCANPDGTAVFLGAFRCIDGRHLWQVDATTGAVAGYGFDGGPYRRGTSTDPGYAAAYTACHQQQPSGSQPP